MNNRITKLVAGGFFLVLVNLSLSLEGQEVRRAALVRVGEIGAVSDLPFFLGLEKGYYSEQGLEVKLERFASGAKMMAPLSAGQLEVGGGAISAGFFNALARGLPVKIVAHRAGIRPGHVGTVFMVRADLANTIKRAQDLKGRKVAIVAPGAVGLYGLGKIMEAAGLDHKAFNVVYMPFPEMRLAFANRAIETANVIEPFVIQFQEQGLAIVTEGISYASVAPSIELAVLFYNQGWAERNPAVANGFMVGYLKAAREHYEALVPGKARDEAIEIITRYTPIKNKKLLQNMAWSYIDPNGRVQRESLKDQQDWYFRNGFVTRKAEVDQMVDEMYADYALTRIGTYPIEKGSK